MRKIGMRRLRTITGVLVILALSVVGVTALTQNTLAANETKKVCDELRGAADVTDDVLEAAGCLESEGSNKSLPALINTLINVAISIVGIISVGALVIAGQRYIVSGGDSSKVVAAKRMITYAVVGLIVSFLAFAVVRFVTTSIGL